MRELIKTIGLYRTKAKNVIGLSQRLVDDFHGRVPHDRDTLESLPGVGRKTANVILTTAFGTVEAALEAIKEGAYDYVGKPVRLDELLHLDGAHWGGQAAEDRGGNENTARQKRTVAKRAGERCEYCLSPAAFSPAGFPPAVPWVWRTS